MSALNFAPEFDFIEAILSVSHENTGILLIYENFMTKSSEHEKKKSIFKMIIHSRFEKIKLQSRKVQNLTFQIFCKIVQKIQNGTFSNIV